VDTVEPGMLYLAYVKPIGWQVYKVEKAPLDSEAYIKEYGYPVKPWIIDQGDPNIPEEEILATPDQIGWFDEGENKPDIVDIEPEHMNKVLDRHMGWLYIEVWEDDGEPVIFQNKVTLSYFEEIDDEWDDDENIQDWKDDEEEPIF
jgi:hypothetical protein